MSGSPTEEPIAEVLEAGIVAVFSKPFLSIMDLATTLNKLVEAE
jgi:hypothetical protein